MSRLRIGTRGSALALAQTGQVARRLESMGVAVELVTIRTSGDRLADQPLHRVGGKGLFIKELEEALVDGRIDLAVHSMKDLPAELDARFQLAAVTARADVRDVLVARRDRLRAPIAADDRARSGAQGGARPEVALAAFASAARIGTGSLRRRAQLAVIRSDLEIVPIRGNVDTRLRKLQAGEFDAIVLAAAGLERLGLDLGAAADVEVAAFAPELFLPAPGQGALALEARADDTATGRACAALDDLPSRLACAAERAFLRRLGASCQVPVAALGRLDAGGAGQLHLDGLVASLDGRQCLRAARTGASPEAEAIGTALANDLLERGAGALLAQALD